MSRRDDYRRHSRRVTSTKRWQRVRKAVLCRDGYQCRSCGARGRLEVDHVKPVRDAPGRAFDPENLQTLCARCHARKTAKEVGFAGPPNPRRSAWSTLLRKPIEQQ